MPSLQTYIDDSRRYPREEFLRYYMCPVLLMSEDASHGAEFSTVTNMMARPSSKQASTAAATALRQAVLPLLKRNGAPFASQISLGRGRGVDVALDNDSVSKFHAYFMVEAERTMLADAGSLNGTTVNGVALTPRTLTPIENGDPVTFGEVRAMFYTAAGFWHYLQKPY